MDAVHIEYIFTAYLHVILPVFSERTHVKGSTLDSPKLGSLFASSRLPRLSHPPQHAKARPSETNHHQHNTTTPTPQGKTTPETTGRPLCLCRNGSHLANPSQTLPVNDNPSIDTPHPHAHLQYSLTQYAQQLYRSERRSIRTWLPIHTLFSSIFRRRAPSHACYPRQPFAAASPRLQDARPRSSPFPTTLCP